MAINQILFTSIPVADQARALAFYVDKLGVEITNGPDDAPWAEGVRWLMVRDTEENLILLESFKEG